MWAAVRPVLKTMSLELRHTASDWQSVTTLCTRFMDVFVGVSELAGRLRCRVVCDNIGLCGDVPAGLTLHSYSGYCATATTGTRLGSPCPSSSPSGTIPHSTQARKAQKWEILDAHALKRYNWARRWVLLSTSHAQCGQYNIVADLRPVMPEHPRQYECAEWHHPHEFWHT